MPLKLACLATKWGRQLHDLASARRIKSTLYTPYVDPTPTSTIFARIDQRRPEEGRAWALRHIRQGRPSVQSLADIQMYENRGAQMSALADYFPRGERPRTMEAAAEAIESLGLPIVSKAPFGSASSTVRALHTKAEALKDAADIFGAGVHFRGLGTQHGECLWQEFMPANYFALRVAIIARAPVSMGWAFKVMNRPGDWRASGSGVCVPLKPSEWEIPRTRYAINTALAAAETMDSRWCAFDMLWDAMAEHGRWRIVDVTLAWNMSRNLLGGNWDAPIYNLGNCTPDPKGRHGRDQFDVLLDSLLEAS